MDSCFFDLTFNPRYPAKILMIGRKALKMLAGDGETKKYGRDTANFVREQATSCFSDRSPKAQRKREELILEQMRLTVCSESRPYKDVTIQEVSQVWLDLGNEARLNCE